MIEFRWALIWGRNNQQNKLYFGRDWKRDVARLYSDRGLDAYNGLGSRAGFGASRFGHFHNTQQRQKTTMRMLDLRM